ncbi:S-adenosylmethionine/tRNA-ribosyltransferase-iso merase [Desulfofarcimen acetoxidans DSM 771]|uniref:S-adenosylmethionine:tRNA ribosyltransferase-isomerase n=1 Tax=Desulfofarcimen acetoxidans (strain ATCC 49208 / DSM 771 / KCTC 5769 / VKM B-1644 / 5575) TaxID=485916 RepID=C8W4D7_DESAS|nr:S-adenosylmethionine/tRNA-ribosyltransferase-iso merase [Desulfofarcimen acetoxidans DSM 771]
MILKLEDFNYNLPEELIAQEPSANRDESRLMVLFRDNPQIEHRRFNNLVEYLKPGDVLVINDTKVMPARLYGLKDTGATVEVLLLKQLDGNRWETLVKPGRKARIGTTLTFAGGKLTGLVAGDTEAGGRVIDFLYQGSFVEILEQIGIMPLPPYIKKIPADPGRYQTVYANRFGSAAAPTAGLHFTDQLLDKIKDLGVEIVPVLLHVGLDTFRPVKVENIREHRMHSEYYEISAGVADKINAAKARGGRIIAVGTTTTRCLESSAGDDGRLKTGSGWTKIFIYPGYRFKIIDGLITNFHLPCSTLIMLVSALSGRDKILEAYNTAVKKKVQIF